MAGNDDLHNALLRHGLDLERYKEWTVARLLAVLRESDADIRAILVNSDFDEAKLSKLTAELNAVVTSSHTEFNQELEKQLLATAGNEASFVNKLYPAVLPVSLAMSTVSGEQLYQIAMSRPFEGRLLRDWSRDLATDKMKRLNRAIQVGMTNGEGIQAITRRVMGTRAERYKDGILEITRRNAEAIVRSAVGHISANIQEAYIEANSDLITQVLWSATFDGRTSPICRARGGKYYRASDKKPVGHSLPWLNGPQKSHFSCRSMALPAFEGEVIADAMGEKPFVRDTRTRRLRERDFRAEAKANAGQEWATLTASQRTARVRDVRRKWAETNIGKVPAAQEYGDWLRKQPRPFVEDVLGDKKASLFLDGGLKLSRFESNGRQLTLKQLEARNASLFEELGLDD